MCGRWSGRGGRWRRLLGCEERAAGMRARVESEGEGVLSR